MIPQIHSFCMTLMIFLFPLPLLIFSGCKSGETGNPAVTAGSVVKCDFEREFSAQGIAMVTTEAFSSTGDNIDELINASTAVKIYLIEYYTKNYDGQMVVASGVVAVPSPETGVYPIAAYLHGTVFEDSETPSFTVADPEYEALLTISLFAGHGYVLVMPDYIGQGKGSKVVRPYLHADSVAASTADMLTAVQSLATTLNVKLNSKLFICGMSQGGHGALALQRYIESSPQSQPFSLTAAASIAGPHAIPAVWEFWLQHSPEGVSPIVVHLIQSYKKIYGFGDALSDIFLPPYDTKVETIDDGTHDGEEMSESLPAELHDLLQEKFIADVSAGTHPFHQAMLANSTYDFAPTTPTRLYHGVNDELVPLSSSEFTVAHMKSLGAKNIELIPIDSEWDHISSVIPSILSAKMWFDTF